MQGQLLKELIKKSGFTQEEFAKKMGISRNYLITMLDNVTLKSKYIDAASKILKISPEQFNVNTPLDAQGASIKDIFNAREKSLEGRDNMVIVPLKAFGGFLTGYADQDYLSSLERTSFPFVRGECFAFEVEGHSMVNDEKDRSYSPGSFVVCTPLEQFSWMVKGKDYILQTTEGIILKAFDKIEGEHCHVHSLNPDYDPLKIHLKKIKVVYHIEYKIAKP